jgi:hypothetical protein
MEQSQSRHHAAGLIIATGGLFVSMAALDRLSTPALRELGPREQLIMWGLLIIGIVIGILGASEAAGFALLPGVVPAAIAGFGGLAGGVDAIRIYLDTLRWLGDSPGPLAAVPSSSNWTLFVGGLLSGGGGFLLSLGRLGIFPRVKPTPDLSMTATGDLAKTHHANRWWMRDRSGSALIWDDQAQTWSPWVPGRDPELPPGWAEVHDGG